jgi:hypothetical protein
MDSQMTSDCRPVALQHMHNSGALFQAFKRMDEAKKLNETNQHSAPQVIDITPADALR